MFTLNDFDKFKKSAKKITMVTAYDYFSAKLVEAAEVDTILVGDSLGMVFAGNSNTLNISVEDMIYHAKAVKKGAPDSFIIVDMPYLSYHISITDTVKNAGRIMQQTGANAVKVEINNITTLDHIKALIAAQIPVIGHIGMTPQSVNMFGGFKAQGKNADSASMILDFAHQLEEVGVIAIVLECMPCDLAQKITQEINIATIGIGAGNSCDGQVLVFYDMLGFDTSHKIKLVKHFANAHEYLVNGLKNYVTEVKNSSFPGEEHCY